MAADYDGTLASEGTMSAEVEGALERLRSSGRRAVVVTGRTLEELKRACPGMELFDYAVLENGGVLYSPLRRESTVLCPPASLALALELERRGVEPVIRGRAILATRRPHEVVVLETIRDLGLELQIIFNGEAVMVLPSGVNKGSGLKAALRDMGLSGHEVVGVGNAENDHSFLAICECAVAVDNAVPAVKANADFCTLGSDGDGVTELIEELVTTDLSGRSPRGTGDLVELALRRDATPVTFPPYGHNLLVSGPSGTGKSTFATGLIERLIDRAYQLCIIDPEGDYSTVDEIVTVGSRVYAPHIDEIVERLSDPEAQVVVNLLGISMQERPDFLSQLVPRLQAMRARTGRPHWIVIDEVHHLLPTTWGLAPSTLPQRLGETLLITYRPRDVLPSILRMVDTAIAVGPSPEGTFAEFARALGIAPPQTPTADTKHNEVVVWQRTAGGDPFIAVVIPAHSERLRHLRKYAEGNLGPNSFVFSGPDARMNLKARNLVSFCEIAAGVDEDTWEFHLRRGDYSEWLRRVIKDVDLAGEVAAIEEAPHLTSPDSRRMVHDAIDRRYMLPS
jgi:3-deoxy-D-manno-octulosonate 8-phosphate phosphatase KdsC-like HAD superfamily phosphatase